MDKYANYDELKRREREGPDYRIVTRGGGSGVAVVAIHGGKIEHGTKEIADAVAGEEHAFYCFEGIKKRANFGLHIKSTHFDEPRGVEIVKNADAVVAIHGCSDAREVVYVGGGDRALKERVKRKLGEAGFAAEESRRPGLKGVNPQNICNRGRTGRGVQLEISDTLRKRMFVYLPRGAGKRKTDVFFEFTAALREAIR